MPSLPDALADRDDRTAAQLRRVGAFVPASCHLAVRDGVEGESLRPLTPRPTTAGP